MNKICLSLFLLGACCLNNISAQTEPQAEATVFNQQITSTHIGNTPDRFSIGSVSSPVTVNEYCAFLNTKATRRVYYYDNFCQPLSIDYPDSQDYYDEVLMDTNSPQSCIIRTIDYDEHWPPGVEVSGCRFYPYPGTYQYTVKDGYGDVIIDALNATYAQQNFNDWRNNPTAQELCNYINNQITSSGGNYCTSLMASYPSASSGDLGSKNNVFQEADDIAQTVNNGTYYANYICDETGYFLFYKDSPTFIVGVGKEYYRPSFIHIFGLCE